MRFAADELAAIIHDAELAVVLMTDREPHGLQMPFDIPLATKESLGSSWLETTDRPSSSERWMCDELYGGSREFRSHAPQPG